jgi:hypothetical protein
MMRGIFAGFVLAAALAACASGGEPPISVREAARAECESRATPPEQMERCLSDTEAAIRSARELELQARRSRSEAGPPRRP